MNLERGFRRLTWVVSIALFIPAMVFVVTIGRDRSDRWNRAGEPYPEGRLSVYEFGSGTMTTFARGTPEIEIKDALDNRSKVEIGGASFPRGMMKQVLRQEAEGTLPPEKKAALEQLRRWDLTSFVYLPPSKAAPSALYSRKAILQAEARRELSQEAQAALAELRRGFGFSPYPVEKPLSALEWVLHSGLALGVATIPWGVFLLLRWIVLGFRTDR